MLVFLFIAMCAAVAAACLFGLLWYLLKQELRTVEGILSSVRECRDRALDYAGKLRNEIAMLNDCLVARTRDLNDLQRRHNELQERLGSLGAQFAEEAQNSERHRREAERLEARLSSTYCAYCGHEEAIDGDGSKIAQHIRACGKHPMRAAEGRIDELEKAIRWHRDQRGDDRCWMDDEALYRALPEGYAPPERDSLVELANCVRFLQSRRNPGTAYVSPERRVEELEGELRDQTALLAERDRAVAERDRLKGQLARAAERAPGYFCLEELT